MEYLNEFVENMDESDLSVDELKELIEHNDDLTSSEIDYVLSLLES